MKDLVNISRTKPVWYVVFLLLDIFLYLVLDYLLLCCEYAFQGDFTGSLLIKLLQDVAIIRYCTLIGKLIFMKIRSRVLGIMLVAVFGLLGIGLVMLFAVKVGYLEITPQLILPD